MGYYTEWTATPIYNQAALCYSIFSSEDYIVPLRILEYQGTQKPVGSNPKQVIPRVLASGRAIGGNLLINSPTPLPRIAISGELDTPIGVLTSSATTPVSSMSFATPLLKLGTTVLTYGDLIASCIEGRIQISSDWKVIEPTWFRDPFGRVFSNVKIEKFSATFVEARPGRQTFSMTLRAFANG